MYIESPGSMCLHGNKLCMLTVTSGKQGVA